MTPCRKHAIVVLLFLATAGISQAQDDEITQYLRSLEVRQGQNLPDVVCVACSVTVAGVVSGDVVAVGGDIEVSGTIEGDAIASGGRVRLLPGATVLGEAVAVGGIVSHEGAAAPKAGLESVPYVHLPGQRSIHPLGALTFVGINCLAALVGGGILRTRRSANIADSIIRQPTSTILSGLVMMTIWVFLWIVMDAKSRMAETAAWAGQAVTTAVLFCGSTGIAWLAGRLAFPRFPPFAKWLSGALIVSALLMVPVAGFLLLLVAMVVGFGAAVSSGLGTDAHWLRTIRLPWAKGQRNKGASGNGAPSAP